MTAAVATSIAMVVLLIISIVALADASHAPRLFRVGPALLCGSTGFWLADRALTVFKMAATTAQMPVKDYIPAVVVVAAAATVAGLLWRLHTKPRPVSLRQQSATIETLLGAALKRAQRVDQ